MSTPDPTLLLEAARAAVGGQLYPAGTLYVVATPIGNLGDLTLRALHGLVLADAVACEDTRHTGTLLARLGLRKPLLAVHQHNEAAGAAAIAARLAAGERVALVSDAGTPAVSDPGARVVAHVAAAGHRVVPLPGVSSVTAALSVAGDAGAEGFDVIGFLPARGAARAAAIGALAGVAPRSQVLLEAPHRIEALVDALAQTVPQRRVTLARELTKQFEAVHTDEAAALPAWLAADPDRRRGEFVVVVHAPPRAADGDVAASALDATAERTLGLLLQDGLPVKQAAALASAICGAPRNALYARALELRSAS